jgi:hypothetical protein
MRVEAMVDLAMEEPDRLLGRLLDPTQRPPDLVILPGVTRLARAAAAGLTQRLQLDPTALDIPAGLRDPGDQWLALAVSGRTLIWRTDRPPPIAVEG